MFALLGHPMRDNVRAVLCGQVGNKYIHVMGIDDQYHQTTGVRGVEQGSKVSELLLFPGTVPKGGRMNHQAATPHRGGVYQQQG